MQLAPGDIFAILRPESAGNALRRADALCQPCREGLCRMCLGRLPPHKTHMYLSLSRLNHWLPGSETHPEIMQGTAEFHHQIADARLPQADAVFDDAATLDTAVDMLNPQPTLVQGLVGSVLLPRQLLTEGFLGRYEDLDLGQRERQKAQIL